MGNRPWFAWAVCLFVALGIGYAGWTAFSRPDEQCYACNRPIHAHSKTVATIGGKSRLFCCPACALSQHEQAGKPVAITALTSYSTGKALSPDRAYVVRGSNVNMCETKREIIGQDNRPADLRYDRCAPSLIAFGSREEAAAFTREHGGEVRPFREIAAAFAK